ncbi:MAG: PD40 domain-containing protein [Flavobacteriia bacterium]|nr:PD40 domain-containing protein [Flavobacteriia bacterium]
MITIQFRGYVSILFLALTLGACQPRGTVTRTVPRVVEQERVVDYRSLTVPEEGGIRFTKFTEENEAIVGPYISSSQGVITWYTPGMIAVSPDGEKVAYVAERDGKRNIFIKNTGGGRTTIQRTFRNNVLDMAYSPDGEYIIFTEEQNNDYNILQIRANQGAAIQQISATSYRESSPVYSPDGELIFYTQGEYVSSLNDYRYYIWSINRATSLKTQYSEGFNPSLTKKKSNVIAVCRNNRETGRGEIYTIDLVSGQETLILSDPEVGYSSPNLSPDGTTLAVVGTTVATESRKENLDIYTVKMDGTNVTQVTFHPGHDVSPIWSPDGSELYFLAQRGNADGSWDVWKMGME